MHAVINNWKLIYYGGKAIHANTMECPTATNKKLSKNMKKKPGKIVKF